MGLIINQKIQELMKGYPTVSDKYNVAPAVLAGSTNVNFGDAVTFSSTNGYFEAITTSLTDANAVAGFVVATNVKLATGFPGTEPQVKPGEAFNLLVNGFMAIELDSGATLASATANSPVHVILATGKMTTVDKYNAGTIVPLANCVFTGVTELQGTKKIAEIYVK